jgi:FkbM family methyltransferase
MVFAAQLIRYLPPGTMSRIRGIIGPGLADWAVRRVAGTIPNRLVQVKDGRRFRVGPDPIFLRICGGGEFEPHETSAVRRLVRDGDCVVDVGANIGWYTTLCSQLVGKSGKVFAFEPVAETFGKLQEHVELNDCSQNTIATAAAVGSSPGSVEIHVFQGLSLARASVALDVGKPLRSNTVPRVTLDAFLADRGVPQVQFLKCDVEGCELDVLRGASQLLSSPAAPLLLVELNAETGSISGFGPSDVWKHLKDLGYRRFYRLGIRDEFLPVSTAQELQRAPNLICAKDGPLHERIVTASRPR